MGRTQEIRDFFASRGGRAGLADLYLSTVNGTLREVSRAVEDMTVRGELVLEGAGYRLVDVPDPRAGQGEAHAKLWRAVHQISARKGWFSRVDLQQLTDVHKRNVSIWLREMLRAESVRQVRRGSYVLSKDAPPRHQPPAFRWPRRGKAKSRRDR